MQIVYFWSVVIFRQVAFQHTVTIKIVLISITTFSCLSSVFLQSIKPLLVITVSLQRKQAEFYDSVMTKIRPEPEYFRVGYYGLGFPSFLQASVMLAFSVFVVNFEAKDSKAISCSQILLFVQLNTAVLWISVNFEFICYFVIA